jgi:hypothetical protein
MSRLLKYAVVLALAVAIGCYIVLGPLSLEAIIPNEQKAAVAPVEPKPPAPSASIDEELDYMVAKRLASLEGWRAFLAAHANGDYAQSAMAEIERRLGAETASQEAPVAQRASAPADNERGYGLSQRLGSLASYAQSATAQVERLLLADKASAPRNAGDFASAPSEARAAAKSADPVSSAAGDAVPARAAAVSNDASRDPKSVDESARAAAPLAGTNAAAGTELAALTQDEICQRDGEHLARLRSNPSSDEATRFASELGCETLRPQILALMESMAPPRTGADVSSAAPPAAQAVNEAAPPPASPVVGADVGALASDETCKRDEDRLARLRSSPSGEEAQRFVSELGCEALRPQLQRLMESLGLVAPAPAADSSASNSSLGQVCASQRAALDRLRKEPSAEAAALFWRDLQCEGLRPQVRLLLESLNITPEPLGSVAAPGQAGGRQGAASDAPTEDGADPVACRKETAELNRIRATPDLSDAKRFASIVTCDALKPQAARLLESLAE